MKISQLTSDIINDLRALNPDDRISERYVLSMLTQFNAQFLKRENDQLRLYTSDIWTPIECLDMVESDVNECAGVKKVHRYMRSVNRLPEMYTYANGPLVKEVLSLDDYNMYHSTTLTNYTAAQKREFKSKEKYFWIRDGYLIIPDGPQKVSLLGCFLQPWRAEMASSSYKGSCIHPLDHNFPCPPHLLEAVKASTIDRLMKVFKRIIEDEVPDLDTNNKGNGTKR
jgi:hypothetical protein